MMRSMVSTVTDGERRVLLVLADLGSATRAEIVDASGLPPAEAENSLETLWRSGFVGCDTTFFAANGGPTADDWRYSVYPKGHDALRHG